jgi:hypothetical protein
MLSTSVPSKSKSSAGPLIYAVSGYTLFPPGKGYPALCSLSRCRGLAIRGVGSNPRMLTHGTGLAAREPRAAGDVTCDASMHAPAA